MVVGMARMLLSLPSSLLRYGGGMAQGMSSSRGGRSGSGHVITMSLHEGDSGRVLVASVVSLPRVW